MISCLILWVWCYMETVSHGLLLEDHFLVLQGVQGS